MTGRRTLRPCQITDHSLPGRSADGSRVFRSHPQSSSAGIAVRRTGRAGHSVMPVWWPRATSAGRRLYGQWKDSINTRPLVWVYVAQLTYSEDLWRLGVVKTATADRQSPLGLFPAQPKPSLYDRFVEALRTRHFSRRTEEAYLHWIRRFLVFHNSTHPHELAQCDVNRCASRIKTTKVYTHLPNCGGQGVRSPLHNLRQAVSSESGRIIQTGRSARRRQGTYVTRWKSSQTNCVPPGSGRRPRLGPTRIGFIQVSLNKNSAAGQSNAHDRTRSD